MKNTTQSLFIMSLLFFATSNLAFAHQYPDKVVEKLGNGLANAVTGFVEIPKTVSIVGGRDGILYGMTTGFFKGIVYAVGRSLSGAFDIATFFIPTTTITKPAFIWDNFSRETTFVEPHMR